MRVRPTFNLWLTPDDAGERSAQRSERESPAACCTCGAEPAPREPVSDVESNFAPAGRPGASSFQVDPMLDWFKA